MRFIREPSGGTLLGLRISGQATGGTFQVTLEGWELTADLLWLSPSRDTLFRHPPSATSGFDTQKGVWRRPHLSCTRHMPR